MFMCTCELSELWMWKPEEINFKVPFYSERILLDRERVSEW